MTLEAAVFEGGYGIAWHKAVAREYERIHPNIRVNLWGDPRVDEKLKPRVLRRDPPDLANCSLPVWKLITAGKLYPLDATLDSPAYGQPETWRNSLVPGVLKDYTYRGRVYAVPSNLNAWVVWYDRRMFRAHGWSPPATWDEFTQLCAKVKAADIAPLAFQGKYPIYAWSTLLSLYHQLAPKKSWDDMQSMHPGAYLDPRFVQASRLVQELAVSYFEPGALAMTHTEAQLEWVNGRAAMVFCGLWLKNEMKSAIPPGFEMSCFAIPVVGGGAGDARGIYGGGAEDFFVFSEAKHPREAADFLKFLTSKTNAMAYVKQLDTLSPVAHSAEGIPIGPELASAVRVLNRSDALFADRITSLFPGFDRTAVTDGLGGLLAGKITPQQFAQKLNDGIEAVRRDPDIFKPPLGADGT